MESNHYPLPISGDALKRNGGKQFTYLILSRCLPPFCT